MLESEDGILESLRESTDVKLTIVGMDGDIKEYDFGRLYADVSLLIKHLRKIGVQARSKIGVYGDNSYEWIVVDLALIAMDCVSVVLATESVRPHELDSIAENYDLSFIFAIGTDRQLSKIKSKYTSKISTTLEISFARFRDSAIGDFDRDVFTVVFSSGTSGKKKGLMLTRQGVENTISSSGRAWSITREDNICIVLPFSNFQQRNLLYLAIGFGCSLCMVSPERMFQNIPILQPTILVGPPSFYQIVENRLAAEDFFGRWRYYLAALMFLFDLGGYNRSFRKWICRKWTYLYGARIRLMFVGAAPVNESLLINLQRIGLPIFQVYGLTEFGWITFNIPGKNRNGSVGMLLKGIDARINSDSELIVRSNTPQSIGYVYEGVSDHNEIFLVNNDIATGDLCRIDSAGYLYIIGRKKNIILTRNGVKINPEDIEIEIEAVTGVEKAMVYSLDEAGTLSCIVWVKDLRAVAEEDLENILNEYNSKQSQSFRRITSFIFKLVGDLNTESGLLTRNLKLNRSAVLQRYYTKTQGEVA